MHCGFEGYEVECVGGGEYDDEADDFAALAVVALEIPDAVHEVAVDCPENKTEKIRKFEVPVQKLVHHPYRGEGDERVHDADQVVFDKVNHGGEIYNSDFGIRNSEWKKIRNLN